MQRSVFGVLFLTGVLGANAARHNIGPCAVRRFGRGSRSIQRPQPRHLGWHVQCGEPCQRAPASGRLCRLALG
jgi:hypothetical protein